MICELYLFLSDSYIGHLLASYWVVANRGYLLRMSKDQRWYDGISARLLSLDMVSVVAIFIILDGYENFDTNGCYHAYRCMWATPQGKAVHFPMLMHQR